MVLGYFRLRKLLPAEWKTQPSKTPDEARRRAIQLYRLALRYAPELQSLYVLDMPVNAIRARFRQEFERHRHISPDTQLDTVNHLLMRGQMELEEMLYMWKTRGHMMKYFTEPYEHSVRSARPQSSIGAVLPGNGASQKELPSQFLNTFLKG